MMKELSKTGYSLAVIQAIALRMAFACWLLFMTFPILAQEHSVSLHLNHVSLLEAINEIKRQSNLNLMYSDEDVKSVTDMFEESCGNFVSLCCGISYGECQFGKSLVGGDKTVYFVNAHCPEWGECGTFYGFSGVFVFYRRYVRHEK